LIPSFSNNSIEYRDGPLRQMTIQKPMSKSATVIIIGATSLILSGCVSVKTEHKIEPIHITMDINVKVDRALDDFFGDLDAQAKDISADE